MYINIEIEELYVGYQMAVVLVVVDTATAECVVTDNGESWAHMYYIQPTDADKTQAQKLDAVFCKCP